MSPADLFPLTWRVKRSVETLEMACEYVDATAGQQFSRPSLARHSSHYAADHLVRSYLALGLIERVSPPGSRPVFFRVVGHAMPTSADAA